jgi:hypothetical protein
MTTNANQAYQRAANKAVDGALTMQKIDKQRELDRFLSRQQGIKARQHEVQTAKECRTTTTALSADIGLRLDVLILETRGFYEKLNRRKSKGHDAQTSQPFKH